MFGGFCPFPLRLGDTNALDGVNAEQYSRMGSDALCGVLGSPFALATIDTAGAGAMLSYNGQNGSGVTFGPTLTSLGVGLMEVEFSRRYQDPYESDYPVRFRSATVTCHGAAPLLASVDIIEPNKMNLTIIQIGVGLVDAKLTLKVF